MTSPKTQSPGRAFLVYSGLRLVLLVVAYSVLLAIGVDGLLAVGGAVLLSALLSLVLLRRQRDAFTEASMTRADEHHAGPGAGQVGVRPTGRGQHRRPAHVRVLHRVEVERSAVRVLGPGGAAGRAAAVVGAGVVRRHGARVVAAVRLDRAHLRDGEARRQQRAEHADDRRRGVAVDDELAACRGAVEADVRHGDEPQVGDGDGAAPSVAAAEPGGRDRLDPEDRLRAGRLPERPERRERRRSSRGPRGRGAQRAGTARGRQQDEQGSHH